MIYLENFTLQKDGDLRRISIAWEEINDETGKTIATNQRATRIITNEEYFEDFDNLMELAKSIAEEE